MRKAALPMHAEASHSHGQNSIHAAPNLPIQGALATPAQLCTKYQISRTTLWRWAQTPGFPAPMRFGRSVRWSPEAVDSFLASQGA